MKHLEPLQKTVSDMEDKLVSSARPSAFKLLVAAVLLVGGAGFGMTRLWNASTSDNISDSRKSELVAEFAQLKSVEIERVAEQDVDAALDTMRLSPDQRQQLKTKVSENRASLSPSLNLEVDPSQLVWITLWDFASADGDVVHLSSAGYESDVTLQKQHIRIAVPLDSSKTVKVTGVHDGGGGITLGVQKGASPFMLPVLRPGQTLTLPVAF